MAKKAETAVKSTAKAKAEPATTTEVAPIVLTPEQYEVEFQKKINSEVKKYSITDKKIAEIKKKHSGLTVTGIDDKTGIAKLKEAVTEVRGLRTGIEDKRVELKADYLRIGKAIDAEAKRLTDLIVAIEQPLKDEKARIDALEAEEKVRKEQEEEKKLNDRVDLIKEAGMSFDGNFYVIANMSMDIGTLKQMKDSDFEFMIAKIKMEAKRIADEKAEQERLAAQKAEADRLEREEFERKQQEQKDKEEQLQKEREEFQRKQDEFAEKQRLAAKEEEDRKAAILQELIDNRSTQLEGYGFLYIKRDKKYLYLNIAGEYSIEEAILATASPEYWKETIATSQQEIAKLVDKKSEIDTAQKEADRLAAIEEQQRKDREAKEEEERLAEVARQKEADRLAALPDVQKALNYFNSLLLVVVPVIGNEEISGIIGDFVVGLNETTSAIQNELNRLNKAGE